MSKLTAKAMTIIALGIGLLWIATTGFSTLAPALEQPPLVYSNIPFPVIEPTYADSPVRMEVHRCNTRGMLFDFDFVRQLHSVDGGKSYMLGSDSSIAQPGCQEGFTNFDLPEGVLPGRYEVIGIITAPGQYNPKHKIVYSSQVFTILPARGPHGS